MSLFGLNRRRSETLLLVIGQLVLIAYVFQVAAFDHWNPATAHAAGTPESSAHALHEHHCHGDVSSCTGSGSGLAVFSPADSVRLPQVPPLLALDTDAGSLVPIAAPPVTLSEPPRIAL